MPADSKGRSCCCSPYSVLCMSPAQNIEEGQALCSFSAAAGCSAQAQRRVWRETIALQRWHSCSSLPVHMLAMACRVCSLVDAQEGRSERASMRSLPAGLHDGHRRSWTDSPLLQHHQQHRNLPYPIASQGCPTRCSTVRSTTSRGSTAVTAEGEELAGGAALEGPAATATTAAATAGHRPTA